MLEAATVYAATLDELSLLERAGRTVAQISLRGAPHTPF